MSVDGDVEEVVEVKMGGIEVFGDDLIDSIIMLFDLILEVLIV